MASLNLNMVTLCGHLTADVELKQTQSGVSVCTFTLAINRPYTKEVNQESDFINCQAWRQTAEFIAKYFKKGSSLCIMGAIQTRSWTDQNNNKRYATEVVADRAFFVDSREEAPRSEAPAPQQQTLPEDQDLPF